MSQAENFHTVAIFAASGNVGKPLARGFLTDPKYKLEVRLFHRPGQTPEKRKELDSFVALGAKLVEADLANEDALASALAGVDVVVSAYGLEGLSGGHEATLIKASKRAGVKRFLLSAFGVNPKEEHPLILVKHKSLQLAQDLGLPFTAIHTAVWPEFLLSPSIGGIDFANRKALVLGDGTFSLSTVSLADVGRLAVRVALHPAAKNKEVGIATEHWTWNSLLAAVDKAAGATFARSTKTLESVNNDFATLAGFPQLAAMLQKTYLTNTAGVDFYAEAFNRVHSDFFADLTDYTTVDKFVKAAVQPK